MAEAFICDYIRTPIGRYGGALSGIRTDDLAALPLKALIARHPGLDGAAVDEVAYGCANQSGEDNRNVARMALLLAGLPETVPGTTLNRLCGSGMDAVLYGARMIGTGEADLVIAGGVESMSRAPYVMGKAAQGFGRDQRLEDTTLGWRFVNPAMLAAHGTDAMPETAENVAEDHGIAREAQDAFALRSQQRAGQAMAAGRLAVEIVPVEVPGGRGGPVTVTEDEHPRPQTTAEAVREVLG
jgi:acetyl-CoA acetyltransferase family protein